MDKERTSRLERAQILAQQNEKRQRDERHEDKAQRAQAREERSERVRQREKQIEQATTRDNESKRAELARRGIQVRDFAKVEAELAARGTMEERAQYLEDWQENFKKFEQEQDRLATTLENEAAREELPQCAVGAQDFALGPSEKGKGKAVEK